MKLQLERDHACYAVTPLSCHGRSISCRRCHRRRAHKACPNRSSVSSCPVPYRRFIISFSNSPTTSNPLRTPTIVLPPSPAASSFLITRSNKSYKHQYANIYFVRLRALRVHVEQRARRRWREVEGHSQLIHPAFG
jgi:hypothetical protein